MGSEEHLFKIIAYDAVFDLLQNDELFSLLNAKEKELIFNALTDQPVIISEFAAVMEKLHMANISDLKLITFERLLGLNKD